MKNFIVNIPRANDGTFYDQYGLTEKEIKSLKSKARFEGRSLRVFLAKHLKKLANDGVK